MGKKKLKDEKKPVEVSRRMLRTVVSHLAKTGLSVDEAKAVTKFIWGAWEWEAKDKRQLAEIAAKTLATMKANEALHASRPISEEATQELQVRLDANDLKLVAELVTQGDEEVASPQDDVSS